MKIDMRWFIVISMLFIYSSSAIAQDDVKNNVKDASYAFNKALIEKDSITLNYMLHPVLSYGHSNAWVQEKDELIRDLFNGTIAYNKVETKRIEVMMVDKKLAILRANLLINADFEGSKGLVFYLHVLQTWKWHHKFGWQLVNRQAVEIKDK